MKKTALRDTLERIITLFDEDPVGFVVNTDSFNRATKKHISSYAGVSIYRDFAWDTDKVGEFFDHKMFSDYKHARTNMPPKEAIDWGGVSPPPHITQKIRFNKDEDGPPYDFITEPVRWDEEKETPISREDLFGSPASAEEKKITIELRPEFAVYVLSSLEVIREVLDENLTSDDSMNVKSRAAALEILCRELAIGLDERASREQIDAIIDELIDRYK